MHPSIHGRPRSPVLIRPPNSCTTLSRSVLARFLPHRRSASASAPALLPKDAPNRSSGISMERLLNLAMDLVIPPATMVTLAFAWPTLTFLRAAEWAVKTLTQEDVRGKVVLVTGASSAVGEQVAYEYARRGAHLVLAARREQRLFAVRDRARALGAGHVLVVAADVVRDDDCRRLVADTVAYLGQLDHLVNAVSLGHDFFFEDAGDTAAFNHLMDINFWGNVYPTYAALPYLRLSRGRVVVNAAVDTWMPMPRMSLYSAAKAAVVDFYETLRYELKDDVGITVATHGGWMSAGDSASTISISGAGGRFTPEEGGASPETQQYGKQQREAAAAASLPILPPPEQALAQAAEEARYARAVVDGACRGDARVRRPASWRDVFLVFRAFAPDVLGWTFRLLLSTPPPPAAAPLGAAPPLVSALPAPPVRPLIDYPAEAAAGVIRRPAAAQLHMLE